MSEIRRATSVDVGALVEAHMRAFPGFFLSQMGTAFVATYYRTALGFPDSLAFVAVDGGSIVGFVVALGSPAKFYRLYTARRLELAVLTIVALVRRPRLLNRVIHNRRRVSKYQPVEDDVVEISSIASVSPGRGIGKKLLDAVETEARKRGFKKLVLTTDAVANDAVNGFYVTAGFVRQASFDDGGRLMNSYAKEIG